MHKLYQYILFAIVLVIAVSASAKAQSSAVLRPSEEIHLFSDRTLYVAGEDIRFSARLSQNNTDLNYPLSRIIYCELITPDGNKVSDGKYLLSNSCASGNLTIPKELITGIYYLRAYTKFMRNFGPASFSYVLVKIVNQAKTEFVSGNTADSSSLTKALNPTETASVFKLSTDKSAYALRNPVTLTIETTSAEPLAGVTVSVVPSASVSEYINPPAIYKNVTDLRYLPETRGVSLSGRLINKVKGNPLPYADLSLTMIDNRDFIPIVTDSSGKFFFALAEQYGSKDLLISTAKPDSINTEILVDNDFCPEKVSLPSPRFSLSEAERLVATQLSNTVQIAKYYSSEAITDSTKKTAEPFYGKASLVLQLDQFIQLPTLDEYFTELTTIVKIRKSGKKKHFSISGPFSEMSVYAPLILIDLVAIDDADKILAVSPMGISRIEIVNEPYIKGDIVYGGIISIISRKNDFAGIDLPSSGLFINYRFLSEKNIIPAASPDAKTPDIRNTLYWVPDIELRQGVKSVHHFDCSDTPGDYSITVKGISKNGTIVSDTKTFSVR